MTTTSLRGIFKTKTGTMYQPVNIDMLDMAYYQRRTKQEQVKHIVENFNPFMLGIILVSLRDGKYYVIDGGHRVMAQKQRGEQTIMCQLVTGLTYEEEAKLFLDFNTCRIGLTPNEKFNSAVEAKQKWALDIVDCLTKYGFSFNRNSTTKEDNMVAAVSTLKIIYNHSGKIGLMNVCRIIRKIWNGDKNSLSAAVFRGIDTFLYNYGNIINENILVYALENVSPADIVLEASRMTNQTLFSYKTQKSSSQVASIIRNLYNAEATRRKTKKLANVFDC